MSVSARRRDRVLGGMSVLIGRRWFPHTGLFAVGLLLRLIWVLRIDRVGFRLGDQMMYQMLADSLLDGTGYRTGGPTARWPPGYSTVLAGVYSVTGNDPMWGEVTNAVIGAVTIVLLMLVIERWVNRTTAVIGGAIYAILPGPILWTDVLVSETLFTAAFVTALLALAWSKPTWGWATIVGVAIGLGALVRGEGLTWMLLPVVLWWPQVSRRALVGRIALVAVCAAAVLSPWTIRNAIVMDAFVPVGTNAGQTLWSGHHAGATGGQTWPPPDYSDQFGDITGVEMELAMTGALRRDAIDYMFSHPAHELQLIPLKLLHLFRGDSYALDWVNFADVKPVSPTNVERIGTLADFGFYSILALSLLGVFVLGRRFWLSPVGRTAIVSFATMLFLYGFLYYGNYRYRVPYTPLMVMVAAVVLERIWRRRVDLRDQTIDVPGR